MKPTRHLSCRYVFDSAILLAWIVSINSAAQPKSNPPINLQDENMLHPADAFTATGFDAGEISLNLPLALSPGWIWWGATDWLTVEADLECWLGGVASFNLRFSLVDQAGLRPALGFETMTQYLGNRLDLIDLADLRVSRKGAHWYNRLNASWKLHHAWRWHISLGATYTHYLAIQDPSTNRLTEYYDRVTPDFSIGIDWRPVDWLSAHATASYGVTFLYLDNVARKYQLVLGTRAAPFLWLPFGPLQALRIEFCLLAFYFREIDQTIIGPIGFIYWQWGKED